ncbi:MAG: xylulokinase [Spirochaetia bacterium]|nr:xylulokinase [Spirochaetia bacterium]
MYSVCGIDLGTQSCKIILYDPGAKRILAKAQAPLDIIAENNGTREQKAEWYEAALADCFAVIDPGLRATIAAIGVSGQQHGFVPLDAEGKAIRPVKLWNDTSTAVECTELTSSAGGQEALLAETGLLMLPGYTAPKILWLKKHEPHAYARLRHVLLPHDYVNFLLTGNYVTEYGDASGTALFDVRVRRWSRRISDLIDPQLIDFLPSLVESDKPVGRVSAKAAQRFGIPEGALVAAGGGDNMMSAIGTGTVRDGFLTMSLGTSGTLYGYSDRPVVDPEGNLAAFCSSTGGWLPLLCTMNCTVASEQVRALLGMSIEELNARAEAAPIGAGGLVVLPFFNGERIPNLPNGRASINGATAANFSKENLARAAMEAAIFGMRIGLESFRRLGFAAQEIRLAGGGAKSRLWRQIAANVTGLPVHVPEEEEAAAFGAAIQALWCFEQASERGKGIEELVDEHVALRDGSTVEPEPESVARYEEAYANYSKYLAALSHLYR